MTGDEKRTTTIPPRFSKGRHVHRRTEEELATMDGRQLMPVLREQVEAKAANAVVAIVKQTNKQLATSVQKR